MLPWMYNSGIEMSLLTLMSVGLEQVMSYNVILVWEQEGDLLLVKIRKFIFRYAIDLDRDKLNTHPSLLLCGIN